MAKTISAVPLKNFKDGTRRFTKDNAVTLSAGEFANYSFAGLVKEKPVEKSTFDLPDRAGFDAGDTGSPLGE